jgi:hypothetical protein
MTLFTAYSDSQHISAIGAWQWQWQAMGGKTTPSINASGGANTSTSTEIATP